MDNGASMTFTSIALILLLLIIIVMFACHILGPRATCGWTWLRSNREEKIGLSKNKLFHANGYMLPSSSAFLLSNSGSFKRFDSIEKEGTSLKNTNQLSQTKHTSAHATTPFWNLPQTESEIPPQPLRPAPAPTTGKTVTFGRVDEITPHGFEAGLRRAYIKEPNYAEVRVPAPRTSLKGGNLPQPLEAPPPPRLASMAAVNGTSAIPRPLVRRQMPLDKFHSENNQARQHPLTRRNSSTNPFLCDATDGAVVQEFHNENHTALNSTECKLLETGEHAFNTTPSPGNELNPFLENGKPPTTIGYRSTDALLNGSKHQTNGTINSKLINLKNPQEYFRQGRSLSDTLWSNDNEAKESKTSPSRSPVRGFIKLPNGKTNPFVGLAQRAKGPHMLQKTFSEDFLFRKIGVGTSGAPSNGNCENGTTTWTFGRSLLRQDSILSLGRRNSSQGSLDSTGSADGLEHAISCDSVDSDSVFLSSLDQPFTQITGQLNVGLEYDNITNDAMELTVKIIEAKNLIPPFTFESLDTFVRIYLVPDHAGALQTEIVKDSRSPYYDESFNFWLRKQQSRHSLWFHLYHNGESHTLIGEAEMEIDETPRSTTTWIPLSDCRKWNAQWGELMFSLSYLPTAERLTIVVVKARNLKLDIQDGQGTTQKRQEIQSIFVKVYLMNNEKKILKKRTSLKRPDRSLIFNESMIFSVPPQGLTTVQLRLTVYGVIDSTTIVPLGHVIAGSCATGKGLRHWHQMLSSLRKPVSMWHVLRRATNQPVFTGGAEAVVAAMQSTALRAKRNSVI